MKQFSALYNAWKEKPIFAVFHEKKFVNIRYGLELDGPAIYFFRGKNVTLQSYTIQHELFHVKLWHTLVNQFGKKGGNSLYAKIPTWLHEADVIGEFIKQNRRVPGRWSATQILSDLEVLNYNIKTRPNWSNSFKKLTGKESLSLKDLENWDITKWLKQF